MYNDYRDARDRVASRITDEDLGTTGPGVYYALAGLLVVCAVAAAFIFAGSSPHEQLAKAPDSNQEKTLPVTVPPPISGLPSTAPTPSPSPAPQE